jgi:hypothetical protein
MLEREGIHMNHKNLRRRVALWVDGEIDQGRHDHAANLRRNGHNGIARVRQFAHQQFAFQFQTDNKKNSPIRPSLIQCTFVTKLNILPSVSPKP